MPDTPHDIDTDRDIRDRIVTYPLGHCTNCGEPLRFCPCLNCQHPNPGVEVADE